MSDEILMTTPTTASGSLSSYSMLSSAAGPRVVAGDNLRLSATTTDSTGTLKLSGRMLLLSGELIALSISLPFSGTGEQTAVGLPLADGWIVGITVRVSSGTITDGEVQAAVDVVQGSLTSGTSVMTLAAGEVTNVRRLGLGAYPVSSQAGTTIVTPTAVTLATLANPSVGTDWSIQVTASQKWLLRSLRAVLVASATAASRVVNFDIYDGTNRYFGWSNTINHTANQTKYYSLNAGAGAALNVNSDVIVVSFPPVTLPAGARIISNTVNIQADDQWSAIAYAYESYSA